jgi:plasmid stabilization system protein ParE
MKRAVERAESPMSLWIELDLAARAAFERRPPDDELLGGVFAFARYAHEASDGDVRTAVLVAFFENVVLSRAARDDLHRWLNQTELDRLSGAFRYNLSAVAYEEFQTAFRKRSRSQTGKPGRHANHGGRRARRRLIKRKRTVWYAAESGSRALIERHAMGRT